MTRAFASTILAAGVVLAIPGAAVAKELKFALHTSPPGPEFEAVGRFKELVEARSGKQLTVTFFPGAVLGGERDNIEQLKVGDIAMTLNGDLLPSLIAPELAPTVVPFVFPSVEAAFEYWNGPMGGRLKDAIADRGKIMVVGLMRRGDRHLTAKRDIRKPDDVTGLKLRVPEIPSWVRAWTAVGAKPTPVAWPEVFSSLQTGVVDAQENPCFNINQAKLYEVQKYLIKTGHLPNMWHWALSKAVFDGLSAEHRKVVVGAAVEAATFGDQVAKTQIDATCQKLVAAGMIAVEPDRKAFWKKARPAIDELGKSWAPGVLEAVAKHFD